MEASPTAKATQELYNLSFKQDATLEELKSGIWKCRLLVLNLSNRIYELEGGRERIPLAECKHGGLYQLDARNINLGVYNHQNKGFIGIRTKFGRPFLATEFHWDTGAPHGTCSPLKLLEMIPDTLQVETRHKFEPGFVDTDCWANDPITGLDRPVHILRYSDKKDQNGKPIRREHIWADTGGVLPGALPVFIKEYKPLFQWLEEKEKQYAEKEISVEKDDTSGDGTR